MLGVYFITMRRVRFTVMWTCFLSGESDLVLIGSVQMLTRGAWWCGDWGVPLDV